MDCKKCSMLFQKYMDNTITSEEKTKMMAHIQNCVKCTHDFNVYRTMRTVFSNPLDLSLPSGFEDRIYQKIDAYELSANEVKRPFVLKKYAMNSIAVCIIAGLFVSSYFYSDTWWDFNQNQIDPPVVSATPKPDNSLEDEIIPAPSDQPETVTQTTEPMPSVKPSEKPQVTKKQSTANPATTPTKKPTASPNVTETAVTPTNAPISTPTPAPSAKPVTGMDSEVKPFARSALVSARIKIDEDVDIKSILTKNKISFFESDNKVIIDSTTYNQIEQILQDNNIDFISMDDATKEQANLIVFIK